MGQKGTLALLSSTPPYARHGAFRELHLNKVDVLFALTASVAADDLNDADETVTTARKNAWEDNIDAEARNPQSGNEEPVATRSQRW
jgi:hypothetical protein